MGDCGQMLEAQAGLWMSSYALTALLQPSSMLMQLLLLPALPASPFPAPQSPLEPVAPQAPPGSRMVKSFRWLLFQLAFVSEPACER